MKLLIVESPAKAKTISKYLDGEFTVKASIGHIRDLPKNNKKAIDIEGGFIPHYEISRGKEAVVAEIQELADKADEVLLATDPDREGEAIAWHIAQAAGLKKPRRVVFHEITRDAVREAILHPRPIDNNLKLAQEARRVLDRLVGYDLSGLIWKKVRYGLSAGRVQSPALRIIMEREREIRAFVPVTFWTITADTKTVKKAEIRFACTEEPTEKEKVDDILKKGKAGKWQVVSVDASEAKRSPRAPFITSTLQQTASSRLGFSPSRTMSIAQRLYEAGHITYMRTDSTNLSKVAVAQAEKVIADMYGKEYVEVRTYATKSKNAQEAHEAIRPTDLSKKKAGSPGEQEKLYDLIWRRTLASQMADAKIMRTKVIANIEGGGIPDFQANGNRMIYKGWLACDDEAMGDEVELPPLAEKDPLDLENLFSEEKQTTPPPRYTEAGLIKELEKRGIGRPSTYAAIIHTIEERGYVEKENKALKPTDTGDVVSTFLENNFMHYINDSFTAEMEDKLDAIANGTGEYEKTLRDFYKPFLKDIKSKEKIEKLTHLGDADKKWKCPKCGSAMVIKLGRTGKFISCARYPDCDGALTIEGQEIKKNEPIGMHPELNIPIFVNVGRFGPYVQLGEKSKENKKPKMASVPKGKDLTTISVPDALKYLSLPKILGNHPDTGAPITASIGRYGPYIVHNSDFRSLKVDDVYTIELARALQILAEPKQQRKGIELIRVIGQNPRTKKDIVIYKSAKGFFLKKGFAHILLPAKADPEKFTLEQALELLKS